MSQDIKQVIVVRKDLKMRRGKEIAQGGHATIAFLLKRLREPVWVIAWKLLTFQFLTAVQWKWFLELGQKKVTLQVNSEDDLMQVYSKAKCYGVEVHLIQDSGLTEFDGVPTVTCLAIGPDLSDNVDPITKNLKLY